MLRSLRLTRPLAVKHLRACSGAAKPKMAAASLGVVRLDYDYPPAPGDIDSPESYAYDVFYRAVPGLTFGMCQHANTTLLTDDIMKGFVEAIKYLDQDENPDFTRCGTWNRGAKHLACTSVPMQPGALAPRCRCRTVQSRGLHLRCKVQLGASAPHLGACTVHGRSVAGPRAYS